MPIMRFLAIFLSLGPWMDLISHLVTVKNISQDLVMVRGHA